MSPIQKACPISLMQRRSRQLAHCCLLLVLCLPIAAALFWALADSSTLIVSARLSPLQIDGELNVWQRVAGGVLTEIPLVFLLIGVWHARRCFLLFSTGHVFSTTVIAHLRRFSSWSVLSAVSNIVCQAALSVAVTLYNAVGHRILAVGIDTNQVFLLFFAALVWLMSLVISEGAKLADENAGFV